ncbi:MULTISPECIES: hypothetical protein [Chelativorans]|jgi:hypothetical protein|uniref:Uncharacterized protein n=1 Tax=Chelativorans sp. (strain BNC1) TaxID=266779 RepID=Q11J35_CHESB|nr:MULTISPECIES: hypothetical protein [Chelativorans]
MNDVSHLISIADEFMRATSTKEVTVSFWVFNDSKKLAALRRGADITVGRYNAALQWFSDQWPENAVWPSGVARPATEQAA